MNIITKHYEQKLKEQADKLLHKNRKEVAINANGTSGYTIKNGSNKGVVLGHIVTQLKKF